MGALRNADYNLRNNGGLGAMVANVLRLVAVA